MGNYSTQKLRELAAELQDSVVGLVDAGGERSANDSLKMQLMTALAVCADHIDRLHGEGIPHIMSITAVKLPGKDNHILYGVDTLGQLWAHNGKGWQAQSNARYIQPPSSEARN